jgi:L-threonylcarbamoyladenylate synthase
VSSEKWQTKVLPVDPEQIEDKLIMEAVKVIQEGQVVAFPTDTVYGLAADSSNFEAVAEIFRIKGRSWERPLILMIAEPEDLKRVVASVPKKARQLIAHYWPGPLTLILPRAKSTLSNICAGRETIGVRCPGNNISRVLIKRAGVPLATTSANISGQPSAKTAEEVKKQLNGKIPLIINGGPTRLGVESTIVDLTESPGRILREGAIPREDLVGLL